MERRDYQGYGRRADELELELYDVVTPEGKAVTSYVEIGEEIILQKDVFTRYADSESEQEYTSDEDEEDEEEDEWSYREEKEKRVLYRHHDTVCDV